MKKIFSKLFVFLGKALSEDNNHPSSARVIVLFVFIILIPCVAFTLVWVAIKYENLIAVVLASVLGFLTSIMGIKAYQKGRESSSSSPGIFEEKSENAQ